MRASAMAGTEPFGQVRLGDVDASLVLLYGALCGARADVLGEEELADGLLPADTAGTIRLPVAVDVFSDARANRDWYDVAVAHRAGHVRAKSFALDLPAVLESLGVPAGALDAPEGEGGAWASYYGLFGRSELALAVFQAVEDLRVESRFTQFAPGLCAALMRVHAAEVAARPRIEGLGPRAQGLECVVRLSLSATERVRVAHEVVGALPVIAGLLAAVRSEDATLTRAAAVAAALYLVLDQLPSTAARAEEVELPALSSCRALLDGEIRARCAGRLPEARVRGFEGEERLAVAVARVRYRDFLGLRYQGMSAGVTPVHQQILLLGAGGSGHSHAHSHGHSHRAGRDRDSSVPPALRPGPPEPLPHEHHEIPDRYYRSRRRSDRGGADRRYPEWDAVRQCYLARWATVREEVAPLGSVSSLRAELARLAPVGRRVARELGDLVHEGRSTLRRVRDGDDVDFDGSVEALAEMRGGAGGEPRAYQRTERTRRAVAVAIAIDLSSSTADPALPPGALKLRRGADRILDREVAAVALLAEQLTRLGDVVGVYGFSGTGRHDVRLWRVKGLRERPSARVLRRLGGLQPQHMTRIAPVIRHLTGALLAESAPTKLLLVVCDGRPLDIDYGDQHADVDPVAYALADTRAAIDEARAAGVRPLVIAIDAAGQEYLSELLGDADSYEVVAEIGALPQALARLYARAGLRARAKHSGPRLPQRETVRLSAAVGSNKEEPWGT